MGRDAPRGNGIDRTGKGRGDSLDVTYRGQIKIKKYKSYTPYSKDTWQHNFHDQVLANAKESCSETPYIHQSGR